MTYPAFEYGPVAKGMFIALVSIIPLLLFIDPNYFFPYLFFLLFLGFGLRPTLQFTGLYNLWNATIGKLEKHWDQQFLDKRAREIENKKELEKIKKSRVRDSRLPKNW